MKKNYTVTFSGEITLEIDETLMSGSYIDQQDAIFDALNENDIASELGPLINNVAPCVTDEDGMFLPDCE